MVYSKIEWNKLANNGRESWKRWSEGSGLPLFGAMLRTIKVVPG